jgi:nucleotide-binding universal stress UspA family protein
MLTAMAKIVVGVDGSDASKDALRWAVEEARLRGASVDAVHAWQAPILPPDVGTSLGPSMSAFEMTDLLPRLEESARLAVEQIVQDVVGEGDGVDITPRAIEGPPANALIDAARDADLLVIGSRGHGGFAGALLGSVSLQAVQHAPCPVVVCRHRGDGDG